MQIIVIGCGKVGTSLATVLVAQGHDVVIVDQDSQLIQAAADIDCIKITGVPIDRDVLRQAGIETADVVCTVTQNDNMNIMVAQIAAEIFQVPQIISRIFNPNSRSVFEAFGLDAICSSELTVQAILRKITGEGQEHYQTVYNTPIIFTTTPIDSSLVGTDITQLATDTGKLIFGLLRQNHLRLATPGLKILSGDEMVLADIQ
jgi:trk system potassium uptake protein TrkA